MFFVVLVILHPYVWHALYRPACARMSTLKQHSDIFKKRSSMVYYLCTCNLWFSRSTWKWSKAWVSAISMSIWTFNDLLLSVRFLTWFFLIYCILWQSSFLWDLILEKSAFWIRLGLRYSFPFLNIAHYWDTRLASVISWTVRGVYKAF